MAESPPYPDDIETLKRLLANREAVIAKLMAEIARLKRWRFGRSAERVNEAPMQPASEDLPPEVPVTKAPGAALPRTESTQAAGEKSNVLPLRRAPRALPAHLPRETVVHAPASCHCPDCGSAMRALGEDVSEMLDFIPGYFKVIRHVRPKLSCGQCSRVVQAHAPARPIERGLPTPGLLAQVLVGKYADHLPLYRQAGIYRRAGIELDRATLADWVRASAQLLDPLAAALGRYVLAAQKIHTDDTPVPVLDPGRGRTKTGRLWAYVRDDRPAASRDPPAVWYQYSPDRKGMHPQQHLAGFTGTLQADAYSGYAALYATGAIVEAACWAHSRRKYYDIYVVDHSPIAAEAIRRIGLLYAIEREMRGQPPVARQTARQARAQPVLAALHQWLEATLLQVSAKSALAGAIRYTLVRWEALTRYCGDGRIEIDNNGAERSIRPLVLGRRNYLFAGSDAGGERAAAIYSLIGTAMLNGVEPYGYLRHVLGRIAEHPINRVDELLPWRIAAELAEVHRQAA
jgi:transposase